MHAERTHECYRPGAPGENWDENPWLSRWGRRFCLAQRRQRAPRAGRAEPAALTVATADRAERVPGMRASSNLLAVLGGSLREGRWFEPVENLRGRMNVAVVSEQFARTHSGRTLTIDDEAYQIIGVLRSDF